MTAHTAIIAALISALLFGASTPFAKLLVGDIPPILLAGLLRSRKIKQWMFYRRDAVGVRRARRALSELL